MSKSRAAIQRVLQSPLFLNKGLIGGEWCAAKSGASFPVLNPANQEVIGHVPDMDQEDTKVAIESAHSAFLTWRKTTVAVRNYRGFNEKALCIFRYKVTTRSYRHHTHILVSHVRMQAHACMHAHTHTRTHTHTHTHTYTHTHTHINS